MGYESEGFRLNGNPLLRSYVFQAFNYVLSRDAVEIKPLATGDNCRWDAIWCSGSQDEDDVWWWFLQGLEEGVEGFGGKHVDFVYDVDFVSGLGRHEANFFPKVPDFVNPPVGSGINLNEVQAAPFVYGYANLAAVAGLVLVSGKAIHRFGQDARSSSFACPAWSGEEVSMGDLSGFYGVFEGTDHMVLAYKLIKVFGAPLPVENLAHLALFLNCNLKRGGCQRSVALAPRDRYQVMEAILTKGGASPLKRLWEKLKKEEPHLWQTWLTKKYTI